MQSKNENIEMSIAHAQRICAGCKYYASTSTCDYYIITKQRRGCKIGECDKYEAGKIERAKTAEPLKPLPKDEYLEYMKGRRAKC